MKMFETGKLARLKKLEIKGKFLFLAMDHGIEHGPTDFNEKTIDPDYVLKIAQKIKISAIVLHKGVALKYLDNYAGKIPLLLKLNGKTNISKGEPFSTQIATVKEAVQMGADAVGYTIYVGSRLEHLMYEQAGKIEKEARDYGIPLVIWSYPRGQDIENKYDTNLVAYAARVALEIGADIAKVYYTGDPKSFSWVVKSGGKCRVVAAGGFKKEGNEFLKDVRDIVDAGASGMAIGRNIWQSEDPVKIGKIVSSIIFNNITLEKAVAMLNEKT
jgi:class I fructose-bisphosphate aldolase